MSWDVLVFDYEGNPPSTDGEEEETPPRPLGSLAEVRSRIDARWPGVSWSTANGGRFEGNGYAIEIGLGDADPVEAIMLHIHGEGDALTALSALAVPNGWSLYDCSEDEYLDPVSPSPDGWEGFQHLRDRGLD